MINGSLQRHSITFFVYSACCWITEFKQSDVLLFLRNPNWYSLRRFSWITTSKIIENSQEYFEDNILKCDPSIVAWHIGVPFIFIGHTIGHINWAHQKGFDWITCTLLNIFIYMITSAWSKRLYISGGMQFSPGSLSDLFVLIVSAWLLHPKRNVVKSHREKSSLYCVHHLEVSTAP